MHLALVSSNSFGGLAGILELYVYIVRHLFISKDQGISCFLWYSLFNLFFSSLFPLALPSVQSLNSVKNDALDIQLKVFEEHKEEDMIEFSHRLEDIRSELEYPSDAEMHTISFDILSTLKRSSENSPLPVSPSLTFSHSFFDPQRTSNNNMVVICGLLYLCKPFKDIKSCVI